MATLYESYNSGDDGNRAFYQTVSWQAQTFTPSTSHTITSVKLKLLRFTGASPGTVTISIWATDANGKPTGGALVSGTTNGNAITDVSPGEWIEITLGDGVALIAGIKYAIVAKSSSDNLSLPLYWRKDSSNPSYTGGSRADSADLGVSWTLDTDEDLMFEEWGGLPVGGTDAPTVTTQECTNVVAQSATGWGNVTVLGGDAPSQHGHCWNTSTDPTTSNSKTSNGAKPNPGQFSSSITGLIPGTKYYVRAYATNSWGTSYGDNVEIAGDVTTIGSRHIWTNGDEFHWWSKGKHYRVKGTEITEADPWWWGF